MNGSADRLATWNVSMTTVLDEVTSEVIDATHIRQRVDDWEKRLNGLYTTIGEWLPEGWQARHGTPMLMHEKLMRKFGVAPKPMPTLELHDRTGQLVKLEPHALWIIGNNGRVDVKRDGRRLLIVDAADNFEEPDWQVARDEQRRHREAVTRDWLIRFLG